MKLYLVGGFLGSGKTTAIHNACLALAKKTIRTAVITNDQGSSLVDTGFISASQIEIKEVVNGCFCCNYDQLEDSIDLLQKDIKPDVIFAESVGSCTDLIATVVKPLQQFHPFLEVVVSVVADARLLPIQLKGSRLFSDNINYIYRKQLDEADILVVNKIDLVSSWKLAEIRQLLEKEYRGKPILFQNSNDHASVQEWLRFLDVFFIKDRPVLDLDYAAYGAGEAELAWLDAEVRVVSLGKSASPAVNKLINGLYSAIRDRQIPIGHLKFLINDGKTTTKISFTSLSDSHSQERFHSDSAEVNVLINARVQADPAILENLFANVILKGRTEGEAELTSDCLRSFKPGIPLPTYRFSSVHIQE